MRMRSRPEISLPKTVNQVEVSPMTIEMVNSKRMRVMRARARPTWRARPCWSVGSLLARIEMKTTLSMPRTTSSASNVKKPM
jgi:hypothetical protein